MKTARRWQKRRNKPFIGTQDHDYSLAHCAISRSNSRLNSFGDAAKAARRGLNTISHSGANSSTRTRSISRNRLFTRFRTTAFPSARGKVKPNRGPAFWGILRQKAVKYWPAIRFPWVYARRKSEVLRIRSGFRVRRCGASACGKEAPSRCAGRKTGLSGVPDGSLVAHRELVAAFGAAACQHGAPILGAHPHPKPMGFGPFTIIRLKCTFWHVILGNGRRPDT